MLLLSLSVRCSGTLRLCACRGDVRQRSRAGVEEVPWAGGAHPLLSCHPQDGFVGGNPPMGSMRFCIEPQIHSAMDLPYAASSQDLSSAVQPYVLRPSVCPP